MRRLFIRAVRGRGLGAIGAVALLLTGCAEMMPPGSGGPEATTAPGVAVPAVAAPGGVVPYTPFDGLKKRLAVIKFENKTKTPIPDASWNIGEGLTEMLTTELFKTGRFIMVERAALTEIVKEQELGQTGLVRKETAAKVGELLGAQLLITGAVTEFEAMAQGGGAGVGFGGLALGLKTQNAHVGVDVRLVDSSTGQILKSQNAAGKAQSTGLGFAANVRGVSFGSDAFQKTPLGEATREAISKAVTFIIGEMERVPWTGRVVQVKDREVYVNAGANMNLKPGLVLATYAKGQELIDPSTGLSLGSKDTHVGIVTLTQVDERFSIGTFIGEKLPARGDLLKLQ